MRTKRKRRVVRYFVEYLGPHKNLRLPGIGKVMPGKRYEIDEKRALFLKQPENSRDWKVIEKYAYIEI